MSTDEEKYKEDLKANGIDVPEEKVEEKSETVEEKTEEKSDVDASKIEPLKDKPKEPEHPQKPRTIYDDYKDLKKDRTTEKDRADNAERERDEWRTKFEAISSADPGKDKSDAEKDLRTYATENGADPDFVERIIAEARKGLKPELDEETKRDLADLKAFKAANSKSIEQTMFNDEFERTTPTFKKLFPTATSEELSAVKSELDKLAHTKEWHDKSLGYIAFENQDTLAALVSPKKRGMESKGHKDVELDTFEFDPEADYSKMSPKEKEAWEKQYKEMSKSEGLATNAQGKKLII